MKRQWVGILSLLVVLAESETVLAQEGKDFWEFQRVVNVIMAGPQPVAVPLDKHVHGHSLPELEDLRVVDTAGTEIPYFTYKTQSGRHSPEKVPSALVAKEMNQTESLVTIDLGVETDFNRVVLQTAPKNFIRTIDILGSVNGSDWTAIRKGLVVYSLKQRFSSTYIQQYMREFYSEYTTGRWISEDLEADLPPSRYRYVRVIMTHALDMEPVELEGLEVYRVMDKSIAEDSYTGTVQKKEAADEGRSMEYTVDFGEAVPLTRIEIQTPEDSFFREVVIESSSDAVEWTNAGEASILSIAYGAFRKDEKSVAFNEVRARYWKLRIKHNDNKPLQVSDIVGVSTRRYIVFFAQSSGRYFIRYGHAGAKSPQYDIGRIFRHSKLEDFTQAVLGDLERNKDFRAWIKAEPWTETRPALLWGVMILVLGGLLFLAMQQVKRVK